MKQSQVSNIVAFHARHTDNSDRIDHPPMAKFTDDELLMRAIDRQVEIDRRSAITYGKTTASGKAYLERANRLLSMRAQLKAIFERKLSEVSTRVTV